MKILQISFSLSSGGAERSICCGFEQRVMQVK